MISIFRLNLPTKLLVILHGEGPLRIHGDRQPSLTGLTKISSCVSWSTLRWARSAVSRRTHELPDRSISRNSRNGCREGDRSRPRRAFRVQPFQPIGCRGLPGSHISRERGKQTTCLFRRSRKRSPRLPADGSIFRWIPDAVFSPARTDDRHSKHLDSTSGTRSFSFGTPPRGVLGSSETISTVTLRQAGDLLAELFLQGLHPTSFRTI